MADEKRELIKVGEVSLILDEAKEQVIGVDWAWTENVTSAIGAVTTINSLKSSLRDVGWTTSVVMAATPPADDPADTQSPTPVDQASVTEASDDQEAPSADLDS